MSYKKSTGSFWERPMSGVTPEREAALSTNVPKYQRDRDQSHLSGNPGDVTVSKSTSTTVGREAGTQSPSEREQQRSSCRCPASRPRNGCKDCRIPRTGSTFGVFGVLKKGRDEYKKHMRAPEFQPQLEIRARNPEGHVRP